MTGKKARSAGTGGTAPRGDSDPRSAVGDAPDVGQTLAERLDYIMSRKINPDTGKLYVLRDLSAKLARMDITASATFIHDLRMGKKTNPTVRTLRGLARALEVSTAFLVGDEAEATDIARGFDDANALAQLRYALQDPQTRLLAARARQLTPMSREQILGMVDRLLQLEGGDSSTDDEP